MASDAPITGAPACALNFRDLTTTLDDLGADLSIITTLISVALDKIDHETATASNVISAAFEIITRAKRETDAACAAAAQSMKEVR